MRIIAGRWKGRGLRAPEGQATRPTADRARQVLFDMLAHAPWSPGLAGLHVLDAFAGTGALGLEALSRGAAHVTFMENDRAALLALRANVAALGAEAVVRAVDALRPPRAPTPAALVLLDPPYGRDLPALALRALAAAGWIAPGAILAVETGLAEMRPDGAGEALAGRVVGAAALHILRAPP